jgi:hypothetical protein
LILLSYRVTRATVDRTILMYALIPTLLV